MSFIGQHLFLLLGFIRQYFPRTHRILRLNFDLIWIDIVKRAFPQDSMQQLQYDENDADRLRNMGYWCNAYYIQPRVPSQTTYKLDLGGPEASFDFTKDNICLGLAFEDGWMEFPEFECYGRIKLTLKVDLITRTMWYEYQSKIRNEYHVPNLPRSAAFFHKSISGSYSLSTIVRPFKIFVCTGQTVYVSEIHQQGEGKWFAAERKPYTIDLRKKDPTPHSPVCPPNDSPYLVILD